MLPPLSNGLLVVENAWQMQMFLRGTLPRSEKRLCSGAPMSLVPTAVVPCLNNARRHGLRTTFGEWHFDRNAVSLPT